MDVKRKIQGLFWVSAEPGPAAPASAERGQPRPAVSAASAAPAAAATSAGVGPKIDFAAIYARTNTAGDPRVDQVLAAFEAMKAAMPPAQLAIAIGATAAAIGADRKSITDTVARRLEAIDAVVAAEQRGAAQRRATRTAELAAATTAATAEIEAAEARIAALRQQLAAATASAQQHDAREQGLATAFEHRARDEAARLIALRDFLAHPGTTPDHR